MSKTIHTTEAIFYCNTDFTGDTTIVMGRETLEVPVDDLIEFLAEVVRFRKIGKLEQADTQELLGLSDGA